MIPSISPIRRAAPVAAIVAATASLAAAHAIPPGGVVVLGDGDQAGLCAVERRRITNVLHGTIFAGGAPAPIVNGAAVTTRSAIAAGTVEYRHDGGLTGDAINVGDDCFGITRVRIDVLPPVCGDGVVGGGEECDPGPAADDACCTAECLLVGGSPTATIACRLRTLIARIRASDVRPALQRILVSSLERVLFRVERIGAETGRRRAAFIRSAVRRLGSFAARVRSYEGRRAITEAERDFLLDASEPLRAELAAMSGAP